MTPRQREVNEIFVADRGEQVSGPVAFWMRNPELGLRHEALRIHMERNTSFPRSLSEVAITFANRHWSAAFPWCRHLAAALRSGTEAAPLDALRIGQPVRFSDLTAQVIYDFSKELLETTGVGEETYLRAIDQLGLEATIEVIALIAYGSLLSISANTFGPDEPEPTDCTLPALGSPPTAPRRAAQQARLAPIEPSVDQEAISAAVAAASSIWRRVPELAAPWLEYEAVLRLESSVPPDIREMITLVVARFWHCPRLWAQQRPRAAAAGLDERIVDALAADQPPANATASQILTWEFIHALLHEGIASDALQNSAIDVMGTTKVIEMVAVCGFQTFVAMTLNVFDESPSSEEIRF